MRYAAPVLAGFMLALPAGLQAQSAPAPFQDQYAEVNGVRPEFSVYEGAAEHLQDVWVAVRASLRVVLEGVSLADVVAGRVPRSVTKLLEQPGAWEGRPVGPSPHP